MKIRRIIVLFLLPLLAYTNEQTLSRSRIYSEKAYQTAWCSKLGGQSEVILSDKTRVDCIVNDYAIEFDFANKWAEAIGQSLYYSYMTNKKAGIVLIIENEIEDTKYLNRLCKVASRHNITVWIIKPSDLR